MQSYMYGVITSNTNDAGGMPGEKSNNIKILQEKADSYMVPDKKSKWQHYFFVHCQPDGYPHGSETPKIKAD